MCRYIIVYIREDIEVNIYVAIIPRIHTSWMHIDSTASRNRPRDVANLTKVHEHNAWWLPTTLVYATPYNPLVLYS